MTLTDVFGTPEVDPDSPSDDPVFMIVVRVHADEEIAVHHRDGTTRQMRMKPV